MRSTAGKHIAGVLDALGIGGAVRERLQEFPNGASAMRAMGDAPGMLSIGCTQVSEILYSEGIALVGPLPAEFELATVYSAAVCSDATEPQAAGRFVERLTGETTRGLRAKAGFDL